MPVSGNRPQVDTPPVDRQRPRLEHCRDMNGEWEVDKGVQLPAADLRTSGRAARLSSRDQGATVSAGRTTST
jgi:hypothetical protein